MKKFSEKLIETAKQAASAAELMDIAKKHGMELTEEKAADYYAQLNPAQGELTMTDWNLWPAAWQGQLHAMNTVNTQWKLTTRKKVPAAAKREGECL